MPAWCCSLPSHSRALPRRGDRHLRRSRWAGNPARFLSDRFMVRGLLSSAMLRVGARHLGCSTPPLSASGCAPGRCRLHQDEHRSQQHPVKREGGGYSKNGDNRECGEMQHGNHLVPPAPTASCANGNGTPSARQNVLKMKDLSPGEKFIVVWQGTRRGQLDAHPRLRLAARQKRAIVVVSGNEPGRTKRTSLPRCSP